MNSFQKLPEIYGFFNKATSATEHPPPFGITLAVLAKATLTVAGLSAGPEERLAAGLRLATWDVVPRCLAVSGNLLCLYGLMC